MPSPTRRRRSPKRRSRSKSRVRSGSRKSSRSKSSSRSRSSSSTPRRSSSDRKSRSDHKSSRRHGSSSSSRKGDDASKSRSYGGPAGAFFLIFILPLIVYSLNLACGKEICTVTQLPKFPSISYFFDVEATLIVLGWILFQIVLCLIPIGGVFEGQQLKSGNRLKYRCNGFFAILISFAAFGLAVYYDLPLTTLYSKFVKLLTASFMFTIFLSIVMYIKSRFVAPNKLAPKGDTGNVVYDFFVGHELNPRIGSFDLKFFFELRPGLLGWLMMNLTFVLKAYKETGTFPPALTMIAAFQIWYVVDALIFEEAILSTVNIVQDGFGYLLLFTDLVWAPFLYTLQTRYLLNHPPELPWYSLAGIALLNVLGYVLFRASTSQKMKFKKNPNSPKFAHLQTIPVSSGKKLLVSGWWGMCRKPNYLGDLLMALAWSLSCGLNPLTYCYPAFFLILLVYRERKENVELKKRYGSGWDRYTQRVKYRIFPFIY